MSFDFFRNVDVKEIRDLVGWSSVCIFKKHYLKQISEISSTVGLGAVVPGSPKSVSASESM